MLEFCRESDEDIFVAQRSGMKSLAIVAVAWRGLIWRSQCCRTWNATVESQVAQDEGEVLHAGERQTL